MNLKRNTGVRLRWMKINRRSLHDDVEAEGGRITMRGAVAEFLDLWGFGGRSMFRTFAELFWRPGYVIRDYLSGRRSVYFPPFKSLFVVVLLYSLVKNFARNKQEAMLNLTEPFEKEDIPLNETMRGLIDLVQSAFEWLMENQFYTAVLQTIIIVCATYLVFRKRADFNIMETFYAHMYIFAQIELVSIPFIFLSSASDSVLLPYDGPDLLSFVFLVIDFRQMYGLSWKKSIWRTLQVSLMLLLFLIVFVLIITVVITIIVIRSDLVFPE